MAQPAAARCLISRAQRYQRWHENPAIAARTSFFAAAAIVNGTLARHALASRFLLDLGVRLESINTERALEILAGRLYRDGPLERNTLDFVRFEQAIVQAHLDGLRRCSPRGYRREIPAINTWLGTLRYGVFRALAHRSFVWAVDAAVSSFGAPLDFAEQHCRVILGAHIAHHATTAPGAGYRALSGIRLER